MPAAAAPPFWIFPLLAFWLSLFLVHGAVLDVEEWLENPEEFAAAYSTAAFNLSRDGKRSPYSRPSYGYSRPSYGYGYGHYYKPYRRPSTTPAPPPVVEEKKECGSGPYHGGPSLDCMLRTECIAQGGILGEPCGRGFSRGFCCEFPHRLGCGETTDDVHVLFRNPDYPDTSSLPFSCVAGIVPRPEACGIRLEFLDSIMGQSRDGYCYQDTFTVLGGGSLEENGFNTPFCGIIKGYATVIPVNQTSDLVQLVINSQSRNVLWNINVTQVHCASLYLPFDDLCGVRNAPVGRGMQLKRSLQSNFTLTSASSNMSLIALQDNQAKILGGVNVGNTQYPWMAAIHYAGQLTCGGTLIARQWVITAAHCVTYYEADGLIPIKSFRVWLGTYNRALRIRPDNSERFRIVRKVERIYIHPEYQGTNFDLAIIKLNETVIYNIAIRPVCFPEDIDELYISSNFIGIITGWGTNGGGLSDTLQSAQVPISRNLDCSNAWNNLNVFIRDSMICAGDGTAATCTGDSGGPLVVQEEDGLYSLVGVASFGAPPDCGSPDFPDVFSRVSSFLSWVALVLAIPLPDF